MSYRNKHKKSRQQTENVEIQERKHVVLDEVNVPKIKEPRPVCKICGQPIEAIIEAISEGENEYSHFDCVLSKLKQIHHVSEEEKLSYIGHGNFAVFVKNDEGQFVIKEKISYESSDLFNSMKNFVEEAKK